MSNLRHLAIAFILLTGAASAQVLGYQNFCQTGGQTVKSQGLTSSTHVQRSYPSCTVTVFLTGTTNKATIFSDNFSTPRTNPFVANTDGSFLFYAATTFCYDVTISGGNTGDSVPAPFTYTDQCIGSGGGAGGLPPGCTASGVGQISCIGSPSFIATNGIVPGTLNIAAFPVVPPKGTVVTAQDGANSSDCILGGGSDVHQCLWTGTNWVANGGGGGGSGVSSVGLALPASLFSVTNSPVTGVGTLTGAFVTNFAANSVFGNCTASLATPGPCSLTSAMIPAINLASSANGGVTGITPIANGGTATSSTLTGLVRGGNPFTAAEISGDGTTSGSNALSVVALHFGATSIPTGTIPTAGQCLEYNGTNITGAVCSGGSGGPTISTNGVNNASQAVLNFSNPSTFNGVTITYSNPSAGNETFTLGGTLNNAGLTNASVAVNSQTCALGSTCTIPFSTNSVSNTSQAGINFINPATFNGLTVTFTNSATNQESFTLGGTLGNAGLTNSNVTVNGQSCVLGSPCNVNSGAANPSIAQNNGAGAALSAASAHTVAIPRLCSDSSGSGTVQSCSTSPSFSPVSGDEILYVTTTSNTGAVTVNVNAAGAKSVHKWSGASVLAAGDLVSNVPVVMIYDGTFWEAQTIGNAPSGGGGGTVGNCATVGGNAYYPAGGTTVGCDGSVTDNGSGTMTAVQYQTSGTTAGYVGLQFAASNPTLLANSAGFLGPSATGTAYALQLPNAAPAANTVMLLGAPSSGISPVTYGTVPNAALTNSSTTVNSQSCVLGSTCAIGYANIAAGALANGTTATTQATGDTSADVATDSFVTTAVNNAIAAVNPAVAVTAASTSSQTGTYANGASGIGATFTITATGAYTLDGVSINAIGQRILLKNQSSAFQNGIYTATIVGTTGVSPVFTRALDYDQSSDINYTGSVPVISGTVNADTSWLLTSSVTAVGTDSLTYIQFTVAPTTIVTSAAALTNNAVMVGGGGQASSTISADTTTTHALMATAGAPAFRALVAADIPTLIPIGNIGSAGLSGTSPVTIASTGVIACATCVTSAAALTLNQLVFGAGSQASAVGDLTGDVTTAGGKATTIAANAVTLAKMATQANATLLSNVSGGSAVPSANALPVTANALIKTSNTNGALAASLTTDDGTTSTYTGTGGTKSPVFTSTGTTAGFMDYPQGTTSSAVAPCNVATSICEQAPAAVTSYLVTKPGAAGTGVRIGVNASSVITENFSSAFGAVSQTAKTALVTTFTVCAATANTACGQAGQYRLTYNVWGSGTACSAVTVGSVVLNLTWTDENAVTHTTINAPMWDQKTAAMTSGQVNFNTALGTEGGSGSMIISTNGTIIQAATTYTACTTGTGTYNLRITTEQLQ